MRLVQVGAVILLYALAIHFFRDFYNAAIASILSLYVATVVTVGWLFGWKSVTSAFEASLPYVSGYSAGFLAIFLCSMSFLGITKHIAFLASFTIISSIFFLSEKIKSVFGFGNNAFCSGWIRFFSIILIVIGCVFSYRFDVLEIFLKIVFLITIFYTVPEFATLEVEVTHNLVGEFPAETIWISSNGVCRSSLSLSKLRVLMNLLKLGSSVVVHPWKRLGKKEIEMLKKNEIKTVRIQRKLPPYLVLLLSVLILIILTLLVRLLSKFQRFVV